MDTHTQQVITSQHLIFRAFKATENLELCEKFLQGHIQVLISYGITKVTTNNKDWMSWDNVYCITAEKKDGTVVGGIRTQLADGEHLLPLEQAVGKMDNRIYKIVESYRNNGGVGELCALWNAKEVAGMGVSIMLTRAGIAIANQANIKTLMGICGEYTLNMFQRVGFVVDKSLGLDGLFPYPKDEYTARILGILNAEDLATAEEFDRQRMLELRKNPVQNCIEKGANDSTIEAEYLLLYADNKFVPIKIE